MKNAALILAMVLTASACSKNENDDRLAKATVAGAKMIYQASAETRADTRSLTDKLGKYMAVDADGNAKPIRFVTEKGDTLDMDISDIGKLGEDYLLMSGNFYFNNVNLESLLVNKHSGNIYAINNNIAMLQPPTFKDKHGNLYKNMLIGDDANLYKFDVSNPEQVTMEGYLTLFDRDSPHNCWVSINGFCHYGLLVGYFIKCPGGRVYAIEDLLPVSDYEGKAFLGFDGCLYCYHYYYSGREACHISKIFRLKERGDNELEAVEVASCSSKDYVGDYFDSNILKKEHVAVGSDGGLFVFSEETGELRYIDLEVKLMYGAKYISSGSLFIVAAHRVQQVSLEDYSVREIDLTKAGYLISTEAVNALPDTPGLSFSGMRYSDGKYVVGTIGEDGSVTAVESTKSSNKITTLLRLN